MADAMEDVRARFLSRAYLAASDSWVWRWVVRTSVAVSRHWGIHQWSPLRSVFGAVPVPEHLKGCLEVDIAEDFGPYHTLRPDALVACND